MILTKLGNVVTNIDFFFHISQESDMYSIFLTHIHIVIRNLRRKKYKSNLSVKFQVKSKFNLIMYFYLYNLIRLDKPNFNK